MRPCLPRLGRTWRPVVTVALVLLTSGILSGCSPATQAAEHSFAMAPLDQMPADVQAAPVPVRESYQFAVANPDVLAQIPCYCGCGAVGHTSNHACYVAERDASGAVTFDPHALGCSICVDITQDTMRLLREGRSVAEIKAYVDQTYAKYGPSNVP